MERLIQANQLFSLRFIEEELLGSSNWMMIMVNLIVAHGISRDTEESIRTTRLKVCSHNGLKM